MRFIILPLLQFLVFTSLVTPFEPFDILSPHLVPGEPPAQECGCQADRERRRERTQRMEDVFKALGVAPGGVIADVGAGGGFYSVRLARAVGSGGRVLAVDISSSALRDLRARVKCEQLENVEVIEGAPDDPRLPEHALDAVLIVNAYHEMTRHQAMLGHIRRALKPEGRLVILEPISPSRRAAPRADQTREHEIAPELVLEEARLAGFALTALEEPFSTPEGGGTEWLMVLTPAPATAPVDGRDDRRTAIAGVIELLISPIPT